MSEHAARNNQLITWHLHVSERAHWCSASQHEWQAKNMVSTHLFCKIQFQQIGFQTIRESSSQICVIFEKLHPFLFSFLSASTRRFEGFLVNLFITFNKTQDLDACWIVEKKDNIKSLFFYCLSLNHTVALLPNKKYFLDIPTSRVQTGNFTHTVNVLLCKCGTFWMYVKNQMKQAPLTMPQVWSASSLCLPSNFLILLGSPLLYLLHNRIPSWDRVYWCPALWCLSPLDPAESPCKNGFWHGVKIL